MGTQTIFMLVVAVILIILSMLFSASESAFFSVNKLRVKFLRGKNHKGAISAGKLLDNKARFLNTVLVGNNIVNIALSAILTSLALELFGSAGVGYATFATTILLLIFGEITPKTIGTNKPESIAFALAPFITFFSIIFRPFIAIFSAFSQMVVKLIGIKNSDGVVSFTEEEIKTLIEVGEEEGILEKSEKKMMHRVFSFTDLDAKDIMTPRTEIITITENESFESVLNLAKKTKLSHFPVQGKNIDDIKGVLYIKDVLGYLSKPTEFNVKKTMREAICILETKNMTTVQQLLKEKTQSIAIVLDEYSGTSGLLTKEDISREIFGVVNDAYEVPEEKINMKINETATIISGKTRLSEVAEQFEIKLKSEYNETIAGFIMETLDGIPKIGDKITVDGFIFVVQALDGLRVSEILVKVEE